MNISCRMLVVALATMSVAIPVAQASNTTSPVVQITTGRVRGATSNGLEVFKGIPYAAPPVGPLRWRPPQAVRPWADVRSATDFGHDCMKIPAPGNGEPASAAPSEDCLYLNVWAPAGRHQKLPVMVWIYGGSFTNGSSASPDYDGAAFARHGLIFVSFNYRLGRFGFFAFPWLVHQDASCCNYAFMDQIAALKWVRKNIAAFGGDPDNVTLFGESAGGMSVNVLLTSPLARGLFKRAIVESGGGRNNIFPYVPLDRPGPHGETSAEQRSLAFARSMGIKGNGAAALAQLRKLPASKIADGLDQAAIFRQKAIYSGPIVGGKPMAQAPEQVFKEGRQAKVPVIIGTTSDDLGFSSAKTLAELFAPFGAHAAQARAAFNPDNDLSTRQARHRIGAVRMMLEPARFVARSVAALGQNAWVYRFSYVQTHMRKKQRDAPHYAEVPFVFETLRQLAAEDAAEFSKNVSSADLAMARTLNAYWVNFAKTGNPNGPGLPHWPAITPDGDQLMNFTMHGPKAETDPAKQQLDLVEPLQK